MLCPWRDLKPGDGPAISTSLTEREAAELARLAAGRAVLEVGSAYGYSTIVMALTGATVTAVDPHAWLNSHDQMQANLGAYGVMEAVTVLREGAETALPRLAAAGHRYGLIWIDGDHSPEAVARDVRLSLPLLAAGGVLACHDYGEDTCPGVAQALDAWRPPDRVVDTLAIYDRLPRWRTYGAGTSCYALDRCELDARCAGYDECAEIDAKD